jgi:hypothetical protein
MKIKERDPDTGEIKEEFTEISQMPSIEDRIKATEDAIVALMGL